jgi:hypothetical protein
MMNDTSPTRDLYILRLVDRASPTDDVVRGRGDVVIVRVLYLWIVDHLMIFSSYIFVLRLAPGENASSLLYV